MSNKIVPALTFPFLTPFYDRLTKLFGYRRLLQKKVVTLLPLKDKERLLDVGCGSGTLVILLKEAYPKALISAIDADEVILKTAREQISASNLQIDLRLARAESLPYPDNTFDYVASTLVFHHLPTDIKKQSMKEIRRVLKKSGSFLLVDLGQSRTLMQKLFYILVAPFEEGRYMQDNIQGKLPVFMKEAGFNVSSAAPSAHGADFWLGKK